MSERSATFIGRVRRVLGPEVTVALDPGLAGVAPIFEGRLQRIGQIGSILRIPQGLVDLVGQVSLVGIAEAAGANLPNAAIEIGERWLQLELLGEIDRGTGRFQRGVGSYPGLDDEVHFSTPEDLGAVFPPPSEKSIRIGYLAASDNVPVCLNVAPFVTRHSAIVGSTGSGKTSCVASILQGFSRGGWQAANIVVVDPHGEYKAALGEHASVRSVLGTGDQAIRVPYWALPALDILSTLTGTLGGPTTQSRFTELVSEQRRAFAASASWLTIDDSAVTADTPIPFDIRVVWHQLDAENNETLGIPRDPDSVTIEHMGNPEALVKNVYSPYGAGGAAPFKGPYHGAHGNVPELLRLALLDPRLSFLTQVSADPATADPLVEELGNWLGRERPISILDFSGVPAAASDVAIGVILNMIFETALRTSPDGVGIGRPRPVLIVLEEAHRFLGSTASTMAHDAANRIAREGRKYGVGLMLVTQRPSELPETALAQTGTVIALRLTNAADQARIRAALPDSVVGLAAVLPSLRTGEAVVTGEAIALPARALIAPPNPFPNAHDPSLDSWRKASSVPDVAAALSAWRGTYTSKEKS